MIVRPIGSEAAGELALLHARAYAGSGERAWSRDEFGQLLAAPGALAFLIEGAGFVLALSSGAEAEILALAVVPEWRRRGAGRRLLAAAMHALAGTGACRLLLDVAADNAAALGLYAGLGFAAAGRRHGYYARPGQAAADALVLERRLGDSPPPPVGV